MLRQIVNYGSPSASTGAYVHQRLDTRALASSKGLHIELPLRKAPHERVTGIIVHPRCTHSTWYVRLHLFGNHGEPAKPANWFGPLDRRGSSSTLWGRTRKRISGSTWWLGQSCQFDTQDFERVAVLMTIGSSGGGWTGKSGVQLDVHVQEVTAG